MPLVPAALLDGTSGPMPAAPLGGTVPLGIADPGVLVAGVGPEELTGWVVGAAAGTVEVDSVPLTEAGVSSVPSPTVDSPQATTDSRTRHVGTGKRMCP
jgi:hypothetical protein